MPRPTLRPNWNLVAVLAFCAFSWTLAADGAYRAAHGGGPGLRHAVQAKAVKAVHTLRRLSRDLA